MSDIYRLSDDSFGDAHYGRVPWIMEFVGIIKERNCEVCGRPQDEPDSNCPLTARMEPKSGRFWPDALGAGHTLAAGVVSARFVDAWERDRLGLLPIGGVVPELPRRRRLRSKRRPDYFWIDGRKLPVGVLDFEASGYINARPCRGCGGIDHDVVASHEARQRPGASYVFRETPEDSHNLFVTNMSHFQLFCREPVRRLIEREGLTNFLLGRVGDGY